MKKFNEWEISYNEDGTITVNPGDEIKTFKSYDEVLAYREYRFEQIKKNYKNPPLETIKGLYIETEEDLHEFDDFELKK